MDFLHDSYAYGTSPLSSAARSSPLRTGLFGYPIAHSLSPAVHSTLYQSASVPWTFSLFETTERSDFAAELSKPDFIGASVTMPNKIAFMAELDEITEEGRVIGAINTTFVRLNDSGTKRHIGTNTDCVGIREAMLKNAPLAVQTGQGKPALVIGGGGAARSAVYALWKWLGASEIYLVNRMQSEVEEIITSTKKTLPGIKLHYVESVEAAQRLPPPCLAVGTIPDFPPSEPGEILASNICQAIMKEAKGVLLEMAYHPGLRTRLYRMAENNGWQVLPGTDALLHICIAQQTIWLEEPPSKLGVSTAMSVIEKSVDKAAP